MKKMLIVCYKAQGKDWQMCREGDDKSVFYTASSKPRIFENIRDARMWAKSCQKWAIEKLGWKDCKFMVQAFA
jgi:hypothetical protein